MLHLSVNAFLGNVHGAELDTRSEETDIDEPLSPSAREIGFSFSKNASLSALAQSPPECLSPSKEEALKDELSPVTEVPSDIRKLKFNIGSSPSDFILEESECEDAQQQQQHASSVKDSQELFKPIVESGESDELETVTDRTELAAAAASETVDQSLESADSEVKSTGVLPEDSHDAGDSSDEEQGFVDDGSGLDRSTLLSFDNIAYEDPALDSDLHGAEQTGKQAYPVVPETRGKRHGRHKVSISSDSDSDKVIDAEMVDIQSTLQTQFQSTPASMLAESLGFEQSKKIQHIAFDDEEDGKPEAAPAEPHESIRETYDAEVLNVIESRRSSNLASIANQPHLFGFLQDDNLAAGDVETGSATDTLMVSADDIMKTSTSSDASAEPTILAATYDLDLGAVSRVVATYDMSPDSVDKAFVVEKQSKVIQSSPDDEVFETEGRVENAPDTEVSSDVAKSAEAADDHLDFDTTEMPFELVTADDVDGYEAYLEVMQQNRAVADEDLGALLDFDVCGPGAIGKPSCSISVESSSCTVLSTAFVQPDLIQGMPLDSDTLASREVHSSSEMQEDQNRVDDELITIYDESYDEDNTVTKTFQISQNLDNLEECSSLLDTSNQLECKDDACECAQHVLASFGKDALDSDNMYRVFQQDTSNSPGDDDVLASSEDTYFGSHYEKQTGDIADEYPLEPELPVDENDDADDDFLTESVEPELMALGEDKEEEEEDCSEQVDLFICSDEGQATAVGVGDSWLTLDPQCLDRPLSPLPDSAYRIVDDTVDSYVARHLLHSSTVDSEAESAVVTPVTRDDNVHSAQAAVIVAQVMANVHTAADAEDGAFRNKRLQNQDVDEGFSQLEDTADLTAKDLQSGSLDEEVDDVDEGVLQADEHQLCDSEDIGCSGETYEHMLHHLQDSARSGTVSADSVLDFDGEYVHQKASEFVNCLVREAQVEAENVGNRSHETARRSLTDYAATGLCRVDEAAEEFDAVSTEISNLDSGSIFDVVHSDRVSDEDAAWPSHDHTEPSKSEAGLNGTSFELNGSEQAASEDYGDSSSVDSFATVVPCHQETIEDRMEDLASVSSSFHSDLHSSYLEDQPEPMLCLDVRDDEFVHEGETEDSSGSEHFEAMRDDLDSSMVEVIPCYESPDEDKCGILDDDFDHSMMMLATIKEEDERSSISGKSGKTGSSSEKVDVTSDSDKQASSTDLLAEYPCRRFVGKSSDKDDVSVSSSLLEFESLEKEMQDRTSLDSLTKLGSQQSVAERSSEASSSLLEFERIEKEMQDRTSHDSLTRLGSLQSVAEHGSHKDNVSVSSSLAEFERLESEIDVSEPTSHVSVHATYGMAGSTTSLNAFLMDDSAYQAESVMHVSQLSDQSLAFDEQFANEAQAVVSMLEAGALPVMHDRMSTEVGASNEPIPMAKDEEAGFSVDTGLPVYPEYQDIVQIIRKASETAHEDASKQSAVHEPDLDSLNERDGDEIGDEDAMVTAEVRDTRLAEDIDNDSLQDESDTRMYADQVVPFYDHPGGTFPRDPAERDVMETSADSIEGIREEQTLNRSTDSLELRSSVAAHDTEAALMQQSLDSLTAERSRDSFDADSLHELSAPVVSGGSDQAAGLLMASVESGAWSQSESLMSNTETLKSSGSSSSHDDGMRISLDSSDALNSATQVNHVSRAVTQNDNISRSKKAELQTTSQSDSCDSHSSVSPSSSCLPLLSQDESHMKHVSGN